MSQKIVWKPEHHSEFVDLCVDLRRFGNIPGTRSLFESFKFMTGSRCDEDHYKIYWDVLAKQWKAWCNLIKCNHMKWAPETMTFGASNEDWSHYLQVNPDAAEYRLSPLPKIVEKLNKIFEGCNIDGEYENVVVEDAEEEEEEEVEAEADNSSKPIKAKRWNDDTHELFLDLLVQETSKFKKPNFPHESWNMMRDKINKDKGKCYTVTQLKNRLDGIRKLWRSWCKLIDDATMKWDPENRRFGATGEDWAIHLKENPKALQFKRKLIRSPEKLEFIYKGVIEPGLPYTPFSRGTARQGTLNANETSDVPMCTPFEAEILSSYVAVPIQYEYTIGECIERLDELEDIEIDSRVYRLCLDLFLKVEHREKFLQIETPSEKTTWLLEKVQDSI